MDNFKLQIIKNMYTKLKNIRLILKDSIEYTPKQNSAFFKTGVGDYSHHDQFMGIRVPALRKIAKKFKNLPLSDLEGLLTSKFNEERLLALIILISQYNATDANKEKLYNFYLQHLNCVNNWNLVDSSAHLIIGAYLWDKDRNILFELAKSKILWERRISIVATWYFIKRQDLDYAFKIAILLLGDKQDLIHKAVGWMLREAGKQNQSALIKFLAYYQNQMPRTMLRYAIEKLPEKQRKSYLLK